MSHANVRSLDAMREFRVKMLEFADVVVDVLASQQQMILGFLNWLEHDRPNFWKQYMLHSFDVIAEARAQLERCLLRTVARHRPTCYEEKLALQAAKQRLEMAQEKIEAVKHWCVTCRHEIDEHDGRRGQLQQYIETDFVRSLATLERMIAAIEAYSEIESAVEEAVPPPANTP
jgi:hypothetical protein